ncbi:glutamate racemase [Alkalilimnicola ehrlichii]|uniref:Glutamate racemase n=1 Tax=Alkalilimnicola ehrlichii TaxID=351052 RepID=A0A3E0WI78_9GAMM|nr:glutamate racemase [Alkalilimnicola ehrlichii]RFA24382.1 glutamate racemase [Alkalilimnicola ehrlichii]RFA31575.1 glutamate racemase [Alkalilimnicola ehrlichii]
MSFADPIGVFDSGVGGLSVLREIHALLPSENLLYVADSAHVPYGEKPVGYVQERSRLIARFCIERGAKALVVACNTATAAAVSLLREEFSLPVVAMEPAVKPAVAASRNGKVGVLATSGTLASARFAALLERFGADTDIITRPCPGLVEQVELGELNSPRTRHLITRYTQPLLEADIDTLILGCTHYPFLRETIGDIIGRHIQLIDTGAAVANQLRRALQEARTLSATAAEGQVEFWTTGSPSAFDQVLSRLWPGADTARLIPTCEPLNPSQKTPSSSCY